MASDRGRLTSGELRQHLARRSSATPLLGTPREELRATISRQVASTPQRVSGWAALRPRLLPALAATAAVVVLLALVLQLPRDAQLPPGHETVPGTPSPDAFSPPPDEGLDGLGFADQPPLHHRLAERGGTWYGYRVRLCNEGPEAALTYVGADARLVLRDGTGVPARNGRGNPFASRADVPSAWSDSTQWIDKATLDHGDCADGWLIFGTAADAEPVRIQWHGRVLDVPVEPVEPLGLPGSAVGEPSPFQLYTHCGLHQSPIQFAGTWWTPVDMPVGISAPEGFGDPYDNGIIVLLSSDEALYTSSAGVRVRLRPTDSPPESQCR